MPSASIHASIASFSGVVSTPPQSMMSPRSITRPMVRIRLVPDRTAATRTVPGPGRSPSPSRSGEGNSAGDARGEARDDLFGRQEEEQDERDRGDDQTGVQHGVGGLEL